MSTTVRLRNLIETLQDLQEIDRKIHAILSLDDPQKRIRDGVQLYAKIDRFPKRMKNELTPDEAAIVRPILIDVIRTLLVEVFDADPQEIGEPNLTAWAAHDHQGP